MGAKKPFLPYALFFGVFPATSRDGRQSEVKASEGTCEQSEALTERQGWYDYAYLQREGALLPACLRGERPVSPACLLHSRTKRRNIAQMLYWALPWLRQQAIR